jgi:hypothetical protein
MEKGKVKLQNKELVQSMHNEDRFPGDSEDETAGFQEEEKKAKDRSYVL